MTSLSHSGDLLTISKSPSSVSTSFSAVFPAEEGKQRQRPRQSQIQRHTFDRPNAKAKSKSKTKTKTKTNFDSELKSRSKTNTKLGSQTTPMEDLERDPKGTQECEKMPSKRCSEEKGLSGCKLIFRYAQQLLSYPETSSDQVATQSHPHPIHNDHHTAAHGIDLNIDGDHGNDRGTIAELQSPSQTQSQTKGHGSKPGRWSEEEHERFVKGKVDRIYGE